MSEPIEIEILKKEIKEIKSRNARVELDKAWEISLTRKVLICVFTYLVVVLFFFFAHLSKPLINAIVPTIGFALSTLSMPYFRQWWVRRNRSDL
jgi:hypothetical protein